MDEAPHTVELDEEWMAEWIAYGYREMGVTLAHHAQFLEWCHRHDRSDTEEGDADEHLAERD